MSNVSMNPGSRPRKGVMSVLGVLGGGLLITGAVLAAAEATDPPAPAAGVELTTFSSCAELSAWGEVAGEQAVLESGMPLVGAPNVAVAGEVAADEAAPAAPSDAAGGADGGATARSSVLDGTNVAVEGVDEIDLVDRLVDDLVLVASASRLAIVDLAAGEVRARTEVPWDAQVTYDAEADVAWVVGHDDATGDVVVERVAVGDAELLVEGRWTTSGSLVDARRVGDELHVVATEGFGGGVVPFAEGPVPCEDVLHPTEDSSPQATLLVTLPATGAVAPVRAAEVVGSGQLVHVTPTAAYLATPHWSPDGRATTGIHRFDLATLAPTGSGTVEGGLLDDFSMSEHDGVLRVAVTEQGGMVGAPIPVDPMPVEPGPGGSGIATDDIVVAPEPGEPGRGEPLNEVVVLDTDGALDVVGRTAPFGHPGETIHGVRFDGEVGYAVTFLTTDPFYVLDLADPTAPRVVGEVELPGFSSYLHPLGGDLVVGFGPGADGRTAAKLFDVADPTAPVVVDDLVLGDDSPVATDHHAFVDLGEGRFAVPATTWDASACGARAGCTQGGTSEVVVVDTSAGRLDVVDRPEVALQVPASRAIPATDGWALLGDAEIVLVDAAGAPAGRIAL